jgi:hypothetical protein
LTGSNMEVNNKNTRVSGRATHAGSTGRLTDKILANPHTALRKEPQWQILKEEDHERQCFDRGKQWWDLGNEGDGGLISQCPLLDEGEEEASTTTTFTPRSLLELCNPGDTQKRGGADLSGLDPPLLEKTGDRVTGADTLLHRIENNCKKKAILAVQPITTQWTKYKGEFDLPPPRPSLVEHHREMCPSGLALHHPAADLLEEWVTNGCPTKLVKRGPNLKCRKQ